MSIIPAAHLSSSELRLLGNNVVQSRKSRPSHQRRQQRILAAVNRSLAAVGEQIGRLKLPLEPELVS